MSLARLGRVAFKLWMCPIVGHSEGTWRASITQTVEWRGDTAYCLAPGCARTSLDDEALDDHHVVVDDGRTWWLLGAISWNGTHLYEARNTRAALAEYRRDITDAERTNGRSFRDIRYLVKASNLSVVAGPLTTVEAFQYDLARAYGDAIEQWTEHIIDVACPATAMTAVDLAEKVKPAMAALIRREARARYLTKEA